MDIVWFLLIGLIAGWIAGQIMRGSGYGIVGDIVVGIVGAFIGGYFFPGLFHIEGLVGAILSATLGAIILLIIIGLARRLT